VRHDFQLCIIAGLLACFFLSCTTANAKQQNSSKPQKNVLIFVVDDQGFQAGCYGNEVIKTPGIDRLANAGTRFTQAHCTSASCSASRSVILSGQYNHSTWLYGLAHRCHHFSADNRIKTLPVVMADAGYRTCRIGKFHVAPEPTFHFEYSRNEGSQSHRNSVRMAENAREWIEEDDSRPFFLYFCTVDPHRGSGPDGFSNHNDNPNYYPGVTPIRYKPEQVIVPSWLPDNLATRRELAEYYQSISRLDQGMVKLIEMLKETGRWDDTLVIFISDNGPPFPGAKTTLYQPGMNLPMIIRDPDAKRSGLVTDAKATWADIVPTVLDYTNVKWPKNAPLHGRSLLPAIEKEHPSGFDEIYASHTFHEVTMYYPMRVVISGRYKCILNLAHQLPYPFASDLWNSPTWQHIHQNGEKMYGNRTVDAYLHRPRYELYDLQKDPSELVNLAEKPEYAQTLAKLQEKLKTWQHKTNDPWVIKYEHE
jgi:N-sulfoglucosamine sulfohydrolase